MFKEFKEFIMRGNVIDLAVGVIIGSAFSSIVTSLTDNFIQPLINLIGGAEIKGTIPLGDSGQALNYGAFLTAVINFLIVAFVLFIIVKTMNTFEKRSKERLEKISARVDGKFGRRKEDKVEEEKEPETKLCPFCYTEISYKATRCPNCTSKLNLLDESTDDIKE